VSAPIPAPKIDSLLFARRGRDGAEEEEEKVEEEEEEVEERAEDREEEVDGDL
tara:strand:- start:13 stop:171 length:159 start_codon:yes stop_codon:yes gene_type:complete